VQLLGDLTVVEWHIRADDPHGGLSHLHIDRTGAALLSGARPIIAHSAPTYIGLLGSFFVVPARGFFQCRFRKGYKGLIGLKSPDFLQPSWIYFRPKQFYCRPRPAAQLLPISPAGNIR
jgi:hypothetical protein